MTLIELMIALIIFGILGVMSYRAVSTAIESRQQVSAKFHRWRGIAHFMQMAESDLTQIVTRPATLTSTDNSALSVMPTSAGNTLEMSFLKLNGASNSVQRRGYKLENDHLMLLRWDGTDGTVMPTSDVILENVRALRVSLLTESGQRLNAWTQASATAGGLPVAIDLELELSDVGTVHRLFTLR